MAPQKRQSDITLKDRLIKEYYSFSFFKAVHLLESIFPDKKPLGHTLLPDEEVVRFTSKPGFVFPPNEISNIECEDKDRPVSMEVTFMGLVGPSGVLPHWYNELVLDKTFHKDYGLKDFYDIFNHRFISLFYLAWKKNRLQINYLNDEKDKVSNYFQSLNGLMASGLVERIGLSQKSLLHFYSGLLSRQIPSSVTIEAIVEAFSGTTVNVEQFIERLIHISQEDQTQIGLANGQLGIDAVCGSCTWENQTKFRINLGPMDHNGFERFLPDGEMLRSAFSLVRYIVGIEFEFEIRVFLKREEVPPCILGVETPPYPRLGWTTWLNSPESIQQEDPYVTFEGIEL
ncbi:MAG: type VI secretion system baseplate subunit TssG [Planctomycetota bacterium]|jgi:type VI secretion system protein ImpH